MPDDESLTHRLLEFLCEADNGVIEDEFGDPMQVGIQHGDGDTLDVFINGRDLGGQLVTLARYRVTVEEVTEETVENPDPSPGEDATPTVRWFCRDADGRETFLDGDEEYARAHQAGFANLTPESRCVLIRRTLAPDGSVLGEEEIDA